MESEILYHKAKTGAICSWKVWTEGPDICTEYGQVGGQMQTSRKTAEPKNVGKKNETTAEDQADAEALALFTFKLERKYSKTPEEAEELVRLPMLATDIDKVKRVVYPADLQPKLDGVRCTARWDGDKVVLYSRSGKVYDVPHISEMIQASEGFLDPDRELDGEIYAHGLSLQEIMTLVKRPREESLALQFHVYDYPNPLDEERTWENRYNDLCAAFGALPEQNTIHLVKTWRVKNKKEQREMFLRCVEDGYEGAILRHLDGLYTYGHRSRDLLKIKEFDDGEFKIIGAYEGIGKFKGCVTWICETEDGKEFHVCPKGTLDEKRLLWEQHENLIGQYEKVKHFGWTDEGIPRFPIGLGVRLPEDV